MVLLFSVIVPNANGNNQPVEVPSFHGKSFAVYILSRGKGVPEEARSFFDSIYKELVALEQSGIVVSLKKERIGLEGEKKLCVEFTDSKNARMMFKKIHPPALEIDLFNIVSESCSK